jgi:4-amino-4-deoxy-L-arabinose transferase-like glycosyltransferase
MTVRKRAAAALSAAMRFLRERRGAIVVAAAATAAVLLLRLPSFFEPPWNTDEGTFAAVAQGVLRGGELYKDAWESKPPLFLLIYTGLFKLFGAGVFPLRLAATASALATQWALYGVARHWLSPRRALAASLLAGVFLGVPFWEGTLALTEVFAVLPSTLGLLLFLRWSRGQAAAGAALLLAGALFGVAALVRQTAVVAPAAAAVWFLLSERPRVAAVALTAGGFAGVVGVAVGAFALAGDFAWFWDANVLFFLEYVPTGEELPWARRGLILLPPAAMVASLLWLRRRGERPWWALAGLWFAFALGAAFLTGRPYSHYLLLAFPPLALILAGAAPDFALLWRSRGSIELPSWRRALSPAILPIAATAVFWAAAALPTFDGNPVAMRYTRGLSYYPNFVTWAAGLKSEADYNDYFDRRVNPTLAVLRVLEETRSRGLTAYVWGEFPWLYALADFDPVSRYVTSFYVLTRPRLDTALAAELGRSRPEVVIVTGDARPKEVARSPVMDRRFRNADSALQQVLRREYRPTGGAGKAVVYRRAPRTTGQAPSETLRPLDEEGLANLEQIY